VHHGLRGITIEPPHLGIPFGIAGLSGTWRATGEGSATAVADVLAGVAAVVAVAVSTPLVVELVRRRRRLWSDLADPAAGPFVPVFAITPMLLSTALLAWSVAVARPLVVPFAVLAVGGGAAVVAYWLVSRLRLLDYQPGFYLPTAGATLLAAQCLSSIGWTGAARVLFAVGLTSWLVLAVVTSWRLAFRPMPVSLRPVVVIELAAPAWPGTPTWSSSAASTATPGSSPS
jgi:tellurite resistance protein